MPESTIDLPDVVRTVQPDQAAFVPGEDIRGKVRIENHGSTHLKVFTGSPALGVLLNTDLHVVGGWQGAIGGTGSSTSLPPGAHMSLNFLAGSDTFDPDLGAALPPGNYLLVISISITETTATWTHHGILATRARPITLTAPPDRL